MSAIDQIQSSFVTAGAPPSGFAEVGSGSQRATAIASPAVASLNCAFPANVVSGNLLIVGGAVDANVDVVVTDTLSTSYTVVRRPAAGVINVWLAYGIAPSSGANTVTATPAASQYISYSIDEFSGEHASPYDDDASFTSGTSTAPLTNGMTSSVTGDLIVGILNKAGTTTITPGSGYTTIGQEEDDLTYIAHSLVFQIVGAASTYTVDWTLGASVDWKTFGIAFKPA